MSYVIQVQLNYFINITKINSLQGMVQHSSLTGWPTHSVLSFSPPSPQLTYCENVESDFFMTMAL